MKPRQIQSRLDRSHRAPSTLLGLLTLVSVVVLLLSDVLPRIFPSGDHRYLGTFPLGLIAVAYLVYQAMRRPGLAEMLKAILLAIAFLFWAANQFLADAAWATRCNDIAIALFVLDVFFVMIGWPADSPDESFAESYLEPRKAPCGRQNCCCEE